VTGSAGNQGQRCMTPLGPRGHRNRSCWICCPSPVAMPAWLPDNWRMICPKWKSRCGQRKPATQLAAKQPHLPNSPQPTHAVL
jgi:hypothetical protein